MGLHYTRIVSASSLMFQWGGAVRMNLQCHRDIKGSDNYPKTQVFGVEGLLSSHTHGKCRGPQQLVSVLRSSFVSEELSLGELGETADTMSFPLYLILHWKVRTQELSRMRYGFSYSCQNSGGPRVEGSCAKCSPAHSPYRRDDGSVQIHQGLRRQVVYQGSHRAVAVGLGWDPQM